MNSADTDHVLVAALAARSRQTAAVGPWDSGSLATLAAAGALREFIPLANGGSGASERRRLHLLAMVAEQCLTTALVLSQWAAAVRLIEAADEDVRSRELPALARGERFTTIGISQLTTSRRHLGQAAVRASHEDGGWRLDGECPWVSGADRADTLVTGALDAAGVPRFFLIDTAAPGVRIGAPLEMLALTGSRTTTVGLSAVRPVAVIAAPAGGPRAGGLATIALALGTARAAAALLTREAGDRANLSPIAAALVAEALAIGADLDHAADEGITPDGRDALRVAATGLALRASQAALTAAKGAGFIVGHPAERLVREACFFLVWSCPPAVSGSVLCTFAGLAAGADGLGDRRGARERPSGASPWAAGVMEGNGGGVAD